MMRSWHFNISFAGKLRRSFGRRLNMIGVKIFKNCLDQNSSNAMAAWWWRNSFFIVCGLKFLLVFVI